jgi:hypothetical protein
MGGWKARLHVRAGTILIPDMQGATVTAGEEELF